MRRVQAVAACLSVALLAPGCSGRSCADVADDFVGALQDVLDQAAEMSPADLQTPDGQLPAFVGDVETEGERLEEEAISLGCTDEQMQTLVAERIDSLEAEPGTVADLLLDFLTRADFFGDPPPS